MKKIFRLIMAFFLMLSMTGIQTPVRAEGGSISAEALRTGSPVLQAAKPSAVTTARDTAVQLMMNKVGKAQDGQCALTICETFRDTPGMYHDKTYYWTSTASAYPGYFNFINSNGSTNYRCEAYTWKDFAEGRYAPRKGDLVFFDASASYNKTLAQHASSDRRGFHVGMLRNEDTSTTKIYSVDGGQTGNKVLTKDRTTAAGTGAVSGWTEKRSDTGKTVQVYAALFIRPCYTAEYVVEGFGNYSGKNYLYNTDFTTLDSSLYSSRNTNVATLSVDANNKHDGYNSLKIANAQAGSAGNSLTFATATNGANNHGDHVGDSKTMTMSFWAKASNSGTNLYIRWGYESSTRHVTLTNSWQYYTVRVDKKIGYDSDLHPYVDRTGNVWISQLQLEDGTSATEFAPDSGPVVYAGGQKYTYTASTYKLPAAPSRAGYTFDGWYTAAKGGTKITNSTQVKNGNIRLYAHWTYNGPTLQYHAEVKPTCTADGTVAYWEDTSTGIKYADSEGTKVLTDSAIVIPKTGHAWSGWTVVTDATCTASGLRKQVCSKCSAENEETIAALGHRYGDWITVIEPGCEEEGLRQQVCANNPSHVKEEAIPAYGHKWGSWTTGREPTCQADGYEIRICENNPDHTETRKLDRLSHDYGEWQVVKEPTYDEEGLAEKVCSLCGDRQTTVLPVIEHDHDLEFVRGKKPSCEEDGNTSYYYCSICGGYYDDPDGNEMISQEDTVIPALGHNLIKTQAKNPTTRKDGNTEYWTCDTCGRYFSDDQGENEIEEGSWIIPRISIPESIEILEDDYIEMETLDTLELTAEILPEGTDDSVTWTSSNKKAATVDSDGVVTAKGYGKTTITATSAANPDLQDTCTIQTRFYDVNDKMQYYYVPVYWGTDHGIVTGFSGGEYFGPQQTCTRAQFVIFIWRIAGKPTAPGTKVTFSDISGKENYFRALQWAVSKKIIGGYTDGTFKPDRYVNRSEVAIMLWKFAGRPDVSVSGNSPFKDINLKNAPTQNTYKSILWGQKTGIIKGYSDGTFKPYADCLREHIVTFLYRYAKNVLKWN